MGQKGLEADTTAPALPPSETPALISSREEDSRAGGAPAWTALWSGALLRHSPDTASPSVCQVLLSAATVSFPGLPEHSVPDQEALTGNRILAQPEARGPDQLLLKLRGRVCPGPSQLGGCQSLAILGCRSITTRPLPPCSHTSSL